MTELQTAYEWCDELDVRVLDPDGWRRDNTSMHHPISREEFVDRLWESTIMQGPKCELFR